MNGILVVDKPSGPTSHDICQYFKRTLPVRKVGHAGTLDPLATGVLVILLDGATKLSQTFMGGDKEYQFTMRLGISTDTYDSEGKVLEEKPVPDGVLEKLKEILKDFTGEILQTPPPFSAIKKNGVPLYKLARKGELVAPQPRKIRIDTLKMCPTLFARTGEAGCSLKSGDSPKPHPLTTPAPGTPSKCRTLSKLGGTTRPFGAPSPQHPSRARGINPTCARRSEVTLHVRCSCGTYVRSIAHDLGQRLGCGAHITALRRLRSEPFGVEEAISLSAD